MPFNYQGTELALFAKATQWKRYWSARIQPHIKGRVLDVGAGVGSNFDYLQHSEVTEWCFLEPDEKLLKQIKLRRQQTLTAAVHNGTVSTLPAHKMFDTIIYIDVLEHIRDDHLELVQAARHLETNGKLLILSPAHPALFSNFDLSVGHLRRYTIKTLSKIAPKNLGPIDLRYLDSAGWLASLANRCLLKQSVPDIRQILFWDRVMVPISRVLDPLCGYRIGKSILGIWKKSMSAG